MASNSQMDMQSQQPVRPHAILYSQENMHGDAMIQTLQQEMQA